MIIHGTSRRGQDATDKDASVAGSMSSMQGQGRRTVHGSSEGSESLASGEVLPVREDDQLGESALGDYRGTTTSTTPSDVRNSTIHSYRGYLLMVHKDHDVSIFFNSEYIETVTSVDSAVALVDEWMVAP